MPADGERCPACGGPLRMWRSAPASDPALRGVPVALHRCGACASARTVGGAPGAPGAPGTRGAPDAPASDLHETGAYRPGEPRLYRLARPLLDLFDRRRLRMLASTAPAPARLLDAGAGRGRFVLCARAAGYDATGIEPSARGAGAAAAIGAPVTRAGIEQAAIEPGSLDAVTLWHVLEHIDDAGAALERIATWLRPGGALLVGVPNIASMQARIGGERWYHLDVPRHRIHFTERGLDALLRRHGFRPVRTHHMLLEHNPFGMWQTLVNRLTRVPSYLYNLLKRNAPLDARDLALTLIALPLVPVAALFELAAGAARRGGTIAILARREAGREGEVP